MIALNRSDYKNKVVGSDKIFYGGYPYKVKLLDNEVSADWQIAAEVNKWLYDPKSTFNRRFCTMSISNWTKNFYFTEKAVLDDFVEVFEDRIDHIAGPISDYHIDQLQFVNKQDKYGNMRYVIKGNNYFNEYDMKLVWSFPYRISNNYYHKPFVKPDYDSLSNYFNDLGKSIEGVCDSRYYDRNVYCNKRDLEDIEFFCKLKHGDVIHCKVEIILIKDL